MATKKLQILESIIKVDDTLKQSGTPADAKAVGDALSAIEYMDSTDDGSGVVTLGKAVQPNGGFAGSASIENGVFVMRSASATISNNSLVVSCN